jgi:hypothetical protein
VSAPERHPAAARLAGRVTVVFGGLLHLMVGALVLAAVGVIPAAGIAAVVLVWLATATLGWRWRHTRPPVVVLLPFVAALALWLAGRLASS